MLQILHYNHRFNLVVGFFLCITAPIFILFFSCYHLQKLVPGCSTYNISHPQLEF